MKLMVLFLLWMVYLSAPVLAQTEQTYTLRGYVKDACGNPTTDVHVGIETRREWQTFRYAVPDKYGYFEIHQVEKGKYKVFTDSDKYGRQTFDSITVDAGIPNRLDLNLACGGYLKRIPQEPVSIISCELKHIPNRNNVMCDILAGAIQLGDEVSLFGSRGNSYVLYIDGIKMRHIQWLPQASIQEVDIWTMSIPANLDYSP